MVLIGWLDYTRQMLIGYFQACEEFKMISRKMYDKCNCIEELADMREWMKSIPEKLKEHQVSRSMQKCSCVLILDCLVNQLLYLVTSTNILTQKEDHIKSLRDVCATSV